MLIILNVLWWLVFLGLTARHFLKGHTHQMVLNGFASLTLLMLLLCQGSLWLLSKHHEQCTVTEVNQ